jgi:hypothetical protein
LNKLRAVTEAQLKILETSWAQWLKLIIPATQEAEIRRLNVQSQPGQIVHETLP